jgi:diaminopimelate epimerase
MLLNFWKYEGAGNDFIIVKNDIDLSSDQIKFLCDRHFGIGSDGLMFVGYKEKKLEVRFHNPDASISFCGNGSRCAMAFAVDELGADGSALSFIGFDGEHKATYKDSYAHIEMHVGGEIKEVDNFHFIDTGAPHAVYRVENVNDIDLVNEAKTARYHSAFKPVGTNVNYFSVNEDGSLSIRTFEKGVEGETLACGTGITACALVYAKDNGKSNFHYVVHAKGGVAEVVGKEGVLWLAGPAKRVFSGELNLLEA